MPTAGCSKSTASRGQRYLRRQVASKCSATAPQRSPELIERSAKIQASGFYDTILDAAGFYDTILDAAYRLWDEGKVLGFALGRGQTSSTQDFRAA